MSLMMDDSDRSDLDLYNLGYKNAMIDLTKEVLPLLFSARGHMKENMFSSVLLKQLSDEVEKLEKYLSDNINSSDDMDK